MPSKTKKITVAAAQFRGSADINKNLSNMKKYIEQAAGKNASLVLFHECALSGYVGSELESTEAIDRKALTEATKALGQLAKKHKIFICYGTTTFEKNVAYNSLRLLGSCGRMKALYHKRGMYGSDTENYAVGEREAIYNIAGFRTGLRICFDFRFPEYFRELLREEVDLALVSFSMIGSNDKKMPVARAHLQSRAAENGMWVLAANNTNGTQNSPTCLIDPDGFIVEEAPANKDAIIFGEIEKGAEPPLRKSIREQARKLIGV